MTKFFLNFFFKSVYNFFDVTAFAVITTLITITDNYWYMALYLLVAPISAIMEFHTNQNYPDEQRLS